MTNNTRDPQQQKSATARPSQEQDQKLREKYGQSPQQVDRENRESFQSLDESVGETTDMNADERAMQRASKKTSSSSESRTSSAISSDEGRRRDEDEIENPDFDKRQNRLEDDRELESSDSSPRPIRG